MSLDRRWPLLRASLCAFLLTCVAVFMACTLHWRLVNDAAQIDYACFLMDHGMAPYKDLAELNMPGIYLVNWGVMHTLGAGAEAWRIFDLSLLAVAGLAMAWIARPQGWLPGVYGGALFALYHGRDGPAQQGQRDLIMAVLLLMAYALAFAALRGQRRWPLFFFGICAVGAAAIKPVALPFALLVLVCIVLRLRHLKRPIGAAIALSLAGMLAAGSVIFAFLAAHGSVHAFLWMIRNTLPYYETLGRMSFPKLAALAISPTLRALLLIGLVVAVLRRAWDWESLMLLGGIGFGIFSYFAQGKGFPYHRYPLLAFAFLWAGIQFAAAMRTPGFARKAALAGLLLGAIFAPIYTVHAARAQWNEDFNRALAADLGRLGGEHLSGRVQCLTTAGDCDTVLYRMRLVQASGLVYDYFIFGPDNLPVIQRSRSEVLRAFNAHPPQVIIVGRGLYGDQADDYHKLNEWPALNEYIQADYRLYDERGFPPALCGYRGYRIYVRKPDAELSPQSANLLRASLQIR